MVRYVKQRDASSCGPVAIINIFKWMNCPITYDFIHVARQLCNWNNARDECGGTTDYNIEKAMRVLRIKKKRKISPTIEEINKHLDNGGAILIGYWFPVKENNTLVKNEGHYTLCIGRTKKQYIMVNDNNKTIARKKAQTIEKMLKYRANDHVCWAWLISK